MKKQVICNLPDSQLEVALRNQNEVAKQAVTRRLKANRLANQNRETSIDFASRTVPKGLLQDFGDYALTFFFNSYLLLSMDSSFVRGYLGCLYPIWTRKPPESPLIPAVRAVSMALLEAWSMSNPNSPISMARPHYLQGVTAVRQFLENAEEVGDDILMAMIMLDMYDGLTSFCGARPHQGPHMKGSQALVATRPRISLSSETSPRMVSEVRNQAVEKALTKKEPVSTDLLSWTNVAKTPESYLGEIELEVANLQFSASTLAASANRASSASSILAKADELDQRLIEWAAAVPEDWVPHYIWDPEHIPQSIRAAGLYQSHCTVHKSIFIANILNGHCCSRIKVQLVIQACLDALDTIPNSRRTTMESNIQHLADTICATVPYFLGDRIGVLRFDDSTVQYPHIGSNNPPTEHYFTAAAYGGMFLAKRLPQLLQPGLPLRAAQREWILGQLQRIRKIYLITA